MLRSFSFIGFCILLIGAMAIGLAFAVTFDSIYLHKVDVSKERVSMHYKDSTGKPICSLGSLALLFQQNKQDLLFAMNGGMYKPDTCPVGLYVENGLLLVALDTNKGAGNFYLNPNGVFYIDTNQKSCICKTSDFKFTNDVQYATQSGPMLVINGNINPLFNPTSVNKQIRNGVGVDKEGNVYMAISREKISFYDFATFFKSKGCSNALYLDGYVSNYVSAGKANSIVPHEAFAAMIAVSRK